MWFCFDHQDGLVFGDNLNTHQENKRKSYLLITPTSSDGSLGD
jgi:hypothetical protein